LKRYLVTITLTALLALSLGGITFAELAQEPAATAPTAEVGPLRAKLAPETGSHGSAAPLSRGGSQGEAPASGRASGNGSGQDAYEVDLGKVWNVHPAYFRKVFDGAGETEPSGLKAKIEQNLYGTIQTKWGPADMLFGSMAKFFASSPVLLDRDYAVRRAMLYD